MTTTDGLARGTEAVDTGGADLACRSARPRSAACSTCSASRSTSKGPVEASERYPIHRAAPSFEEQTTATEVFETGPQGDRPDRAVRQGRQGRRLRRRRRGQDGHHPGADPQRRRGARRLLGVRRRRRALARGQRPAPRDDRVGRHRQDRDGLRPDERAARRAPARRPDRPDVRRVLPRRGPRRAAVHRQHLPLHPGRLRGVGAARPNAVGGGLPAQPGHRDGRPAGAHHVDQDGLDHLAPGDLRARRRLHRPGAGDDLRPPRLDRSGSSAT